MMTTTVGASLQFAHSLFTRGTDLFRAEEIRAVSRLDVSVPPVPFTEQELTRARELDQMLIYQPPAAITGRRIHELTGNKTSDDKPFLTDWYGRNEEFFTNDSIRNEWRLVSRAPIPGSRNQNYLEQTATLCEYLVQVFGTDMPKVAREAIAEFQSHKEELVKLLDKDWKEAAKQLVALKVNQMFRETPAEAFWSLALYEGINHERLLPPGSWTWTNKLSSDGRVVDVGSFVEDGVGVDNDNPRNRDDNLGVRFSRSGNLEL